ncbi:hypothetical protein L3X38_034232 [Prunus dulcis]|uniref:Uncharacterized protein n=1 Tax=Prunus dulcis TaxID=3755 RepID=A0AAD4VHQ2_PRUDU|nr:hypothetical protein L3X38_034232 [Prunus dulcis]
MHHPSSSPTLPQSSSSQSPSADDTPPVSSPASSNLSDVNHNNLNAYGVETFVQINSSKNADMPNWRSFDVGRRVMGSGFGNGDMVIQFDSSFFGAPTMLELVVDKILG